MRKTDLKAVGWILEVECVLRCKGENISTKSRVEDLRMFEVHLGKFHQSTLEAELEDC